MIILQARQCAGQKSCPDINESVITEPKLGGKEEMMPYWTLHRAMMITFLCAMLISMAPPPRAPSAQATTVNPTSRTGPSSKCPGMEKVERGERRRACPYRSS